MSDNEHLTMSRLFRDYTDMFSTGDYDVGLIKAVRHEILLAAGMVPIWQPSCRFGREKKKEVSQQVQTAAS